MKKLLYLIPILLIILNLTPDALYKDTVGFSGKESTVESLAPGNWTIVNYNIGSSLASPLALNATSSSLQTTNLSTVINSALSSNAQFKGFPFGAYFNNSDFTTTSYSKATEQISALSWLWSTVDLLLVILVFVIVYSLNKKDKKKTVNSQDNTSNVINNLNTNSFSTTAENLSQNNDN